MVRAKKESTQLTDVELEMMTIIWAIGPCSIHEMMETLSAHRDLAYTSVSTMVRILEQKKFVKSSKEGKGHLYSALVSRAEYETVSVKHLVDKVFTGETSQLVRCLISHKNLKQEDIEQMRAWLEKQP
jgi:predicted transcriptional regulator